MGKFLYTERALSCLFCLRDKKEIADMCEAGTQEEPLGP